MKPVTTYLNTIETELYEYLLVIKPGKDVQKMIETETVLFDKEYNDKAVLKTIPQIVIADFVAREAMEETIIRWIQRICNQQETFTVTLNNYSGLPPHSIYLRVQNEKPFHKLAKDLLVVKNYIISCSCPPMKLMGRPYLPVSQIHSEEIYCKALTHFAHRSFHETFEVNELILIRRENSSGYSRPVNIFHFPPANKTKSN